MISNEKSPRLCQAVLIILLLTRISESRAAVKHRPEVVTALTVLIVSKAFHAGDLMGKNLD